MVFDPFVGWGDNNTKLTIIHVLDMNGPLSAKRIFSKLKKDFGISISYQAAHKALKKMEESDILKEDDHEYKINPQWVSKMKSFVGQLEKSAHAMNQVISKLDDGKIVNFTIETEAEMGYFVLDFMYDYTKTDAKHPIIMNNFFVWTILPLDNEKFKILQEIIKRNGVYIATRENKKYDEIMKRHWEDAGGKVRIGIKDCVSNCDVIVAGDYIINIYWDPKHLKAAIESTDHVKEESDLNVHELYDILSWKTKLDFVVMKNKEVAENIRKRTLGYFNV